MAKDKKPVHKVQMTEGNLNNINLNFIELQ